jgi:hypothetical protein
LHKSFEPTDIDQRIGSLSNYKYLTRAAGYPLIRRLDLVEDFVELSKVKSLLSFVHITDLHVIDVCSPSRLVALNQYLIELSQSDPQTAREFSFAFRPYEALSLQVLDRMIKQINKISVGPISGSKVRLVVNTGDNSENKQLNELNNYIKSLDGCEKINPNPNGGFYVGVQDDLKTSNEQFFYHPNRSDRPDFYKTHLGYPDYNNLLNSAMKPFMSRGLKLPWYSGNGNHDLTLLSEFKVLLDKISTGKQFVQEIQPEQLSGFRDALKSQNASSFSEVFNQCVLRETPNNNSRIHFDTSDYIKQHFESRSKPKGHGYKKSNLENNTLYYVRKSKV